MKKWLLPILLIAGTCCAQSGVRFDNNAWQAATNVPVGAQAPMYTVPFATVTECTDSSCATPVNLYADNALTQLLTQPLTADEYGRFGFWTHPGTYWQTTCTADQNCLSGYITIGSGSGGGGLTGLNGDCLAGDQSSACTVRMVHGLNAAKTYTIDSANTSGVPLAMYYKDTATKIAYSTYESSTLGTSVDGVTPGPTSVFELDNTSTNPLATEQSLILQNYGLNFIDNNNNAGAQPGGTFTMSDAPFLADHANTPHAIFFETPQTGASGNDNPIIYPYGPQPASGGTQRSVFLELAKNTRVDSLFNDEGWFVNKWALSGGDVTCASNTIDLSAGYTLAKFPACTLSTILPPFQADQIFLNATAVVYVYADGAFTTTNSGNISSTPFTATAGQMYMFFYHGGTGDYGGTAGTWTIYPLGGGGGGIGYPGAGIANSTGTSWGTSYAAQGTDAKLLTSGTVSGTGANLCTDANGGATTTGCSSTGLTLTTTGTSGAATLVGSTLNIPVYAGGSAGFYGDILSAQKPSGTTAYSAAKAQALAASGTATLINYTGGSPGYVSHIFFALNNTSGDPTKDTVKVFIDGSGTPSITIPMQNMCMATYLWKAASTGNVSNSSYFTTATSMSGSGGTNVGCNFELPIPFNTGVQITVTDTTAAASTIWYTVEYHTGVPTSTWTNTRVLHMDSINDQTGITANTVTTLSNYTGGQPGRFVGLWWMEDSVPGSASPTTAPMEGVVALTLDGAGSPNIQSSGTEDWFGLSNYFQGNGTGGTGGGGLAQIQGGWKSADGQVAITFMSNSTGSTQGAARFHVHNPITFNSGEKLTWACGNTSVISFTGTCTLWSTVYYYTQN